MDLSGATLKAGAARLVIASGRIRSVDAATGEVRGDFRLFDGVVLPRGASEFTVEASQAFEVHLLTSKAEADGSRSYRFFASCPPEALGALDLLFNAAKHPTLLEQVMR